MHQIKEHFPNIKFNIASSIYLIGVIIVTLNFSFFNKDSFFSILSILISITFLFCAYQNKKMEVNKLVGNGIIKWISTVCVFSLCLWYSKHRLNFDYDIEVEYLNYSVYGYAFAIAIPLCLFIYGLCIFIYMYIGRVTAYQSFYAAIIAIPLCYLLKNYIHGQHGINFVLTMGLILILPYCFMMLLKNINNANNNIFIIFKEIPFDIKKMKSLLSMWFKKALTTTNNYMKITDLLSIASALIYIGSFSIGIIPEHQRAFLLLDAFYRTDCNDKKDSFLYLRKSKNECYRITTKGLEVKKMESFHSSH